MLNKLSLMTFTLDVDVALKKITTEQCLLLAKEAGINYIDIMPNSLDQADNYLNACSKTNMNVYCYIANISFFSNDDEKIRDELLTHLNSAKRLNAKLFMIVPIDVSKDEKICKKLGKNNVQDVLKKYFNHAVTLAKEYGIKVCFETTPRAYSYLSGIEDCKWILDEVNGLGLVYDTANMLAYGDDSLKYYEVLKDYIIYVHLKDVKLSKQTFKDKIFHAELTNNMECMKCCVYGEGVIPLKTIIKNMENDGYDGYFALEYSHPDKYPATYIQNKEQLNKHLDWLKNNIN